MSTENPAKSGTVVMRPRARLIGLIGDELISELADNELYCYQACKARIASERAEIMRTTPWLLTDPFAA